MAAAKVGGILANREQKAEFIYENLMIESNVVHNAWRFGVKKLLYLGSSCIYPKNWKQPIKEKYLLSDYLEKKDELDKLIKATGFMEQKAQGGRIGYRNGSGPYQDYLQDLKDEGHGWLSSEMRKRIKWDIGITNLTKKELKRL